MQESWRSQSLINRQLTPRKQKFISAYFRSEQTVAISDARYESDEVLGVIGGAFVATIITLIAKLILLRQVGAKIYGSDAYFYLLLADIIRHKNHRLPTSSPLLFGGTEWFIPSLQSWLGSFIARETLERHQATTSIAAKCLLTAVVGVVSGLGATQSGDVGAGFCGLVGALLYGLSPINRNANPTNAMDFTFSPRPLSAFLTGAGFAMMLFAIYLLSWPWLLFASIFFGLSLTSSLFSAQVVLLVAGTTALLTQAWWTLLVLPFSVVVAVTLTKGFYFQILQKHVEFLIYYFTNLSTDNLKGVQSAFASLNFLRAVYFAITFQRSKLIALCREDVVLRGLLLYPLHIVVAIILLCDPTIVISAEPVQSWTRILALSWLAAVIWFALTSLPWLKFLGEGDRYLEYAGVIPATALPLVLATSTPRPDYLILSSLFVVANLQWFISGVFPAPEQSESRERVRFWRWMEATLPDSARVAIVPVSESYEGIYRTSLPFLSHPQFDHKNANLLVSYPYPNLDPAFLQGLGVTHLVVRADCDDAPGAAELVAGRKPQFSTQAFSIYSIDS